ncbi:MAG TPA: hypothetical protein VHE55_14460 [Fimbriimonadaceae bacterium]|nr:hypothetical protein [Fimbriimonadaceae bacterium]
MKRVVPLFIQPIQKIGNKIIHVGPKVPYVENHHYRRIGNLIFDSYEGNSTNGGNPDVPTDGLYGETFIPTAPGNRWYFGDDFYCPYSVTHYTNVFPGQAGKDALGFDFVMHVNAATATDPNPQSVTVVDVVMSGDGFDVNNPMPPTNYLNGVELTYGAIAPGSFIYSNVDLTASPLPMPTSTNGWYAILFATGLDGSGNPIECPNAQPLYWGTKVLNPSVVDQYEYLDGDSSFGSQTGTADQLFTFQFGSYGTASDYTVTRGNEQGTHDVAKLQGTPGSDVVVQQALQSVLSFNNAEVTATIQLDPSVVVSNLTLLRGVVVAKANAIPLNDPSAKMVMYMKNNTTGAYDVVKTITPVINAGTDGTLIIAPSIPITNISKYINTNVSPPTVSLRFAVKHARPALLGWRLTINYMSVDYDTIGPDPLAPSLAFSTPN